MNEELAMNEVKGTDEDSDLLDPEEQNTYLEQIEDWNVVDNHHLTKRYEFDNFVDALEYVNQVGEFAEEVNHHPEITFSWGYVDLEIYTHDLDGLRKSDFVWAAKTDAIYNENF